MQFGNFLLCTTSLVLGMQLVQAQEWQAYEEIKATLESGMVANEQFEQSIDSLEYTALNIQNHNGDSHEVYRLCSIALQMDRMHDMVTVIEVRDRCNIICNVSKFIPDIITCLINFAADKSKQEYRTKNITITIKSLKCGDLCDFEMINDNIQKTNSLYDHIQDLYAVNIASKIETSCRKYFNKHAFTFMTQCILETNDMLSDTLLTLDYVELKNKYFECIKKTGFSESVFADRFRVIIGESESTLCSNLINEIAERLLTDQIKSKSEYFDPNSIKALIQHLYGTGLQDVIYNGLCICLESIILHIQNAAENSFLDAYDNYAIWLKEYILGIGTPYLDKKPEDFVADYENLQRRGELRISGFISNFYLFHNVSNYVYGCNLFKLNSSYRAGCMKIVLNERITYGNILLLSSILDDPSISSEGIFSQVIFINMRKQLDLGWGYNKDKKLVLNDTARECYYEPIGFDIIKANVIGKRKRERSVYLSTALGTIEAENPDCQQKITYEIQNQVVKSVEYRRVEIILLDDNEFLNESDVSARACNIVVISNVASLDLSIETYKDDQVIKITRTYRYPDIDRAVILENELEFTENSQQKTEVIEIKYLPNFIIYLRCIHFLPISTTLRIFSYDKPVGYNHGDISIPISCNMPFELDARVCKRLYKIKETIVAYYGKKEDVKIQILEISMSDFLTRRVHSDRWNEITKYFLVKANINAKLLEKALDEFLFNRNTYDATNENEISGIETKNHKVTILAVVRSDNRTLVYLLTKEFESQHKYSSISKALNIYREMSKHVSYQCNPRILDCIYRTSKCPTSLFPYILKSMSDIRSNPFNITDKDIGFEENKKSIQRVTMLIGKSIQKVMSDSFSSGRFNRNSYGLKTCYITSLGKLLENDVLFIARKLQILYDRINSKTTIKISIRSFGEFIKTDNEDISELKSLFMQSHCDQ